MNFRIAILSFIVFFTGCTTPGIFLEESNYSVKQHRVAITQALGPVREVSRNGRVIYSAYHDSKFKEIDVTPKTKERYYTKVSVLGAIRPYKVAVEVLIDRRDPDTKQFAFAEQDEELAQKRARTIKEMLNQSRDELTTFDEENPF